MKCNISIQIFTPCNTSIPTSCFEWQTFNRLKIALYSLV